MDLSYIDWIKRFWKLRMETGFSAAESDLFYCLLEQCNCLGWKNPFQQPNMLLCGLLGVTEKTLIASRNKLKQAGLIDFQSGAKGRHTSYTLIDKPCKNYSQGYSQDGSHKGSQDDSQAGSFTPDNIRLRQPERINEQTGARRGKGIPTLGEVIAAGQRIGCDKEECERFWNHFEAVDWVNKHNQTITNWQSKLASWKTDNHQQKPTNHANNHHITATDPAAHRADKRSREFEEPPPRIKILNKP